MSTAKKNDVPPSPCRECGGTKFWKVSASEHAGDAGEHAQFLTDRAEALFEEQWLDVLVCKHCGTAVFRVANLRRFQTVAAHADSGVESVESPEPGGPFR